MSSTTNSINKKFLFAPILIAFALVGIIWLAYLINPRILNVGRSGIFNYWTAFQEFSNSKNPYDPSVLSLRIAPRPEAGIVWNPPQIFVILYPFLSLSFENSVRLLLFSNILAMPIIACLILRLFEVKDRSIKAASYVSSIAFMPAWNAFGMGQWSLLICLSMIFSMFLMTRGRQVLAGLAFLPVIIKPHIPYLLLLAFAWWIIKEGRFRFALSFLAGLTTLSLVALFISPEIFFQWMGISFSPAVMKTPTLVTFLRLSLESNRVLPDWPMILVPATSSILLLSWLNFRKKTIQWERLAPSLTCLSLILSPYSWIYDFSLLLPLQVMLVIQVLGSNSDWAKFEILSYLVWTQCISIICYNSIPSHYFAALPLIHFVIYLRAQYLLDQLVGTGNNENP